MTVVPEIDITSLLDGAGHGSTAASMSTARAIDAACREVGFFTVVGHGVDPALQARLDALAREFFALPETEKAAIAMARGGRAWRGWFPVGGELTSGTPDRKEGLYVGTDLASDDPRVRAGVPMHGANLFPEHPAGLRDATRAYMRALTRAGHAVLAGMALGLGLEQQWFTQHLTADPLVLFRIFHYPPAAPDAEPSGPDAGWGVGEHTDYGLVTLLGQDGTGGLQVHTPTGWVEVDADPSRLVCNLGDMLERLTGGRYRSTPHRVHNATDQDRLSFPFFLDPSWDAVVERLPIVARPGPDDLADDARQRWDHASVHGFTGTYGDYILTKVGKVFPALAAAEIR